MNGCMFGPDGITESLEYWECLELLGPFGIMFGILGILGMIVKFGMVGRTATVGTMACCECWEFLALRLIIGLGSNVLVHACIYEYVSVMAGLSFFLLRL